MATIQFSAFQSPESRGYVSLRPLIRFNPDPRQDRAPHFKFNILFFQPSFPLYLLRPLITFRFGLFGPHGCGLYFSVFILACKLGSILPESTPQIFFPFSHFHFPLFPFYHGFSQSRPLLATPPKIKQRQRDRPRGLEKVLRTFSSPLVAPLRGRGFAGAWATPPKLFFPESAQKSSSPGTPKTCFRHNPLADLCPALPQRPPDQILNA